MKALFKRNMDERIRIEINKIYRICYRILNLGILFDLLLQFSAHYSSDGGTATFCRPVELAVFLAANILCLVLMRCKGISDDNHFAEAETFPHAYYLAVSSLSALISTALFGALMTWQLLPLGYDNLPFIILMPCVSIFLLTAPSIYAFQYLFFRLAKKRRNDIADTFDQNND